VRGQISDVVVAAAAASAARNKRLTMFFFLPFSRSLAKATAIGLPDRLPALQSDWMLGHTEICRGRVQGYGGDCGGEETILVVS